MSLQEAVDGRHKPCHDKKMLRQLDEAR